MPASVYEQLHRDCLAARDARLKAEQDQYELASLRHGKASFRLDLALIRLRRALRRKDRADQPRGPAGQVGGGQFTDGGSGRGSNPVSRARRLAEVIRVCVLSGVSRTMNGHGVKTHTAEDECPRGQTFKRQGFGHNPPGLVRDPFE
jgi:hypothetical protein